MGAAAGVEVETLDVDQPNGSLETLGQETRPYAELFEIADFGGSVGHFSGCIDFSGNSFFQSVEIVSIEARNVELDIAPVDAEMKGSRPPAEVAQGHGGQHVLAGVLLHVVPATRPVQLQNYRSPRHRLREEVTDLLSVLLYVENDDLADSPVVGRLAAAFRVEDGVCEDHKRGSVLLAGGNHFSGEFGQPTVAVIGGFAHGFSFTSAIAHGPRA